MMKENIKLQKLVDSVMTNEQRDFHDEITQLQAAIKQTEKAKENELKKKEADMNILKANMEEM